MPVVWLRIRGDVVKTTILRKYSKLIALFCMAAAASSCSSIAKGVTSAILDQDSGVEDHLCRVDGAEFEGLTQRLNTERPSSDIKTMRMLFVHGIGAHAENYSESFAREIARGMGLTVRDGKQKRIKLGMARHLGAGVVHLPGDDLGSLLVTRYMNRTKTKELMTFELLWSGYNETARNELIESDKDTAKLRAGVNDTIKTFFNKQIVDPVKYLGDNSAAVRGHVRQAACWMFAGEWDNYKSVGKNSKGTVCPLLQSDQKAFAIRDSIIANDQLVAVTHSLGSRIFLDAFTIQNDERQFEVNPFEPEYLGYGLVHKDVTVVMLANQLPLLQQGLSDQNGFSWPGVPWKNSERYNGKWAGFYEGSSRVSGLEPKAMAFNEYRSKADLCKDTDIPNSQRRFRKMNLVSVSDPNDLLSYRLLGGDFVEEYVDWRLCAEVSEVLISVSQPLSLFGLQLANPSDAHNNYWTDHGLVQLLLQGTKDRSQADLIFSFDEKGRTVDENALLLDNGDLETKKTKDRYQCELTVYE